jgi:hypothetical protein
MKLSTILRLTTCVLLLATASHAQTIRRVNNNPGVTGLNVYTTAQAAHDAAVANDILVIEPSGTSYGDLTLTKPLKIYGNGYYLTTNTELKADQRSSILGVVSLNTGSGGSLLSGITINSGFNIYGVSNIVIQRCLSPAVNTIYDSNIANTIYSDVSNIIISQNNIPNTIQASPTSKTISNVLISNNLLSNITAGNTTYIQNWIVKNNTSLAMNNNTLANSIYENNILSYGTTSFTSSNVTFSYNVSATNTFIGGVGNQNNFDVTSALIGTGTGISADEAFQIKTGSPLKTAGSGGIEIGAFGGPTPYVVSGIPAIPSTTSLTNTATGSNTVPLQVTISVKGNN